MSGGAWSNDIPREIVLPPDAVGDEPRTFIGPDDPIALALSQDTAIVQYWRYPDRAFLLSVERSGGIDTGQWHLWSVDEINPVVYQWIDCTHEVTLPGQSQLAIAENLPAAALDSALSVIICGHSVVPNAVASRNISVGGSTTSATFVDYPGPVDVSLTGKRFSDTDLLATVGVDVFATVAGTGMEFALKIGSTDYTVAAFVNNLANTHMLVYGQRLISSIASGAVTARLRWRRISGTGTVSAGSDEYWSVSLAETINFA